MKPTVIPFPHDPRARRARTLDVAARAIPLLEAALREGNATLLGELFAVLGAEAAGEGALGRLEAIRIGEAEIVRLRARK